MKKTIAILILALTFSSNSFSQSSFKIYPSAYYTYGDYTDGTISNSFSGYVPFTWNGFDYITLGFDNLNIDNPLWKYQQQMLLAGGTFNFYPFYLKPGYTYIKGDFDYKPFTYKYSDFLNLYSIEALYNKDLFYFGLAFDYSNLTGYQVLVIKHYGGSILWIPKPEVSIEIKPVYTSVTDGRRLYSASISLTYLPVKFLLLKLYGSIGERAYYYDEDLLTMFNQNETQKNLVTFRVEYDILDKLTLVGVYEYTEFESYIIRYYVLGLKANLFL